MKQTYQIPTLMIVMMMAAAAVMLLLPITTTAYAQNPANIFPQLPVTIQPDRTFESIVDGFRLKVPAGWVVEDFDNEDPMMRGTEQMFGGTIILAIICSDYLPGLGGTYDCQAPATGTGEEVAVARISNIESRPEVQSLIISQNKSVTTQDLVTLFLTHPGIPNTDYEIVNSWDRQVKVVNSGSSSAAIPAETTTTPAKLVRLSYTDVSGREDTHTFILFVLSPDGNTGYFLTSPGQLATATAPSPQVQEIFDSFELIVR